MTFSHSIGKLLPFPITEYGIAAYRNTVFILGGYDGLSYKSEILEFDPATEEWKVTAQLTEPKGRTATMMVDTVFFPPCE